MTAGGVKEEEEDGSSPVGRGGAGTYIEGELGAFYLLQMLAGSEARGLPNARIQEVQFQGGDEGYALDDLIVHGSSHKGSSLLEIQSKRTIKFSPKDAIFQSVCEQIVRSAPGDKPSDRHLFAVAAERTSFAISGPYQDVLAWAQVAKTGAQFFERLRLKGVASDAMRDFAQTFRANLIDQGITDDDETIWGIVRRFLILEFDFESAAPMARAHSLALAAHVLAPEDAARAEALWSNLIELVIKTGKTGGSISRAELPKLLTDRGFRLAGNRNYALSRARLAEMSSLTLRDIGTTVGGVNLSRPSALAAVEGARDQHRFIEITGKPGVGKSYVLRHLAERIGRESHVIVLDPIGTPDGGWTALAQRLDIPGTAKEFLADLAVSGGGVLFVDGLDMFVSPERRRTVNDLLREIAKIDGFSVVVSTRPDFDTESRSWLAEDALTLLGPPHKVVVGELDDEEIATLSELAPELSALLAPGHPAASISRNLYRLTQLLKVPSSVEIRTEAALADRWWQTADGAQTGQVRAAQRILADLAKAALAGRDTIEAAADSPARDHLLRSLTLSEQKRDRLGFYHDVLRDWTIGALIYEDPTLLQEIDLSVPPSPSLMRGIEFAGRFALEKNKDGSAWYALLVTLSPARSHDGWRRQALMAVVRSELSLQLLNRCKSTLLAHGGALLSELCTAITAVETTPVAEILAKAGIANGEFLETPRSLRTATSSSALNVIIWCAVNVNEIPIQAIASIVKLVEIQIFLAVGISQFGQMTARMLFKWLIQLDLQDTAVEIPSPPDAPRLPSQARQQMISDLRSMTLMLAGNAPEETKVYLAAVAAENNPYKVKEIRQFSRILASAAPCEFAALVEASLIETPHHELPRRSLSDRALSFADTDYLPASPAQPPFLDLLEAAPETGLALIRKLVATGVAFHARAKSTTTNGYTLVFNGKPRFFPWVETYFWARGQAQEYSAASGLMALEAWSQERLDRSDDVQAVLDDIFGPEGSCAAYLLVAIDVLVSHWPSTREALVPFLATPELLSNDRTRTTHEALAGMFVRKEPNGRVKLADLAKRPSRRIILEDLLPYYLADDGAGRNLRTLLRSAVEEIGPYSDHSNFGDPAFMGACALNRLDRANWVEVDEGLSYRSPPVEAEHLAKLEESRRKLVGSSEIEAKIQLAVNDPARGAVELAREAVDYAGGSLPDGSDTDHLKSRSTRLIATAMLVARDGDDDLLMRHEGWVREVIAKALEEEGERFSSGDILGYNRPGMSICALIHLWNRRGRQSDRNLFIETATRKDLAAVLASKAALTVITETDPRVLKSAVRVAFACRRWRWHPYDEDVASRAAYEAEKERLHREAVSSEIVWLDGGPEPIWPILPEESPSLRDESSARRAKALRGSREGADEASVASWSRAASVHVDTQAIAKWLELLSQEGHATPEWYVELIEAYASWSVRLNGYGHPADTDLDRSPDDWNYAFYKLIATALMDAAPDRFGSILQPIVELPDRSFCDIAHTIVHAADVLYFNDRNRAADRAVELRERFVERMMAFRRWSWEGRHGGMRVDYTNGPPIAVLVMNLYTAFSGTQSYLVPAVFDRVDPLLETLRPMLPGGPTAFIALCTMNTLLVAPTARHLDFLLHAAETWLAEPQKDPSMWQALGIGRKIAQWFEGAAVKDPSLISQAHFERSRIDTILGRLVSFGVSEAHDIEVQIQSGKGDIAASR
ncbi:hypothetical protein [Rhizobium sp. 1399]|uniref:hypothetical protein n=1 Tax=Rhizobium sp. 1399 TaxID=2817758 RepID=UPI002858E8C4|nr:hypothetical protein [Rhizobium sp. 1399]MDR6670212.1 hypothetical protein [Rhizobium sp. 1399]